MSTDVIQRDTDHLAPVDLLAVLGPVIDTVIDTGAAAEGARPGAAWAGVVLLDPPADARLGDLLTRMAEHGEGIVVLRRRDDVSLVDEGSTLADLVCFGRRSLFDPAHLLAPGGALLAEPLLLAYGDAATAALRAADLGPCFRIAPDQP